MKDQTLFYLWSKEIDVSTSVYTKNVTYIHIQFKSHRPNEQCITITTEIM